MGRFIFPFPKASKARIIPALYHQIKFLSLHPFHPLTIPPLR